YHNRIENAQLRFGGATHALTPHPDAAPHSLHGPAQRRPWHVRAQDGASAVLALDYAADADWPWAFQARQHFTLEENGLGLVLTLRNAGSVPMPAGLGWHPYFPAGSVAHDARFHWPMRPDYLPTGERQAGPGPAAATLYLEHWSQALVKRDGWETVLTASPEFTHLVVHEAGPYQCLEAATHLANGFNLAADGTAQTGMRVLAPGEMLEGRVDIRLRRLGSEAS
uniref:aldose epimerase family protein n=1 Tax=Devosia sp. TaxID=1871048 RepID=UPI002AFE22DE